MIELIEDTKSLEDNIINILTNFVISNNNGKNNVKRLVKDIKKTEKMIKQLKSNDVKIKKQIKSIKVICDNLETEIAEKIDVINNLLNK